MTSNPWKRQGRREAYDNPWITVSHDDVTRPDGNPGIYGVVHYKNVAVGVVAIDAADRVLLVGQYRYTVDEYSWEIPEGGAPSNEDPLDAAKRELREETGVTARKWTALGKLHLSNSVSDEVGFYFLAEDLEEGEAEPDGTEELAVKWVPFEEVMRMVRSSEITDALSVLSLLRVESDRRAGSAAADGTG